MVNCCGWLTMDEMAFEFVCTKETIKNWIKDGLPCEKVGRTYQFNLEDVHNWFLIGWFEKLEPEEQYAKISQFYQTKKKRKAKRCTKNKTF